jgi:predicted dehydrogenase
MTASGTSRGPLRLGVVGLGRISQVAHLPATTKADRVRLVAVCDASPTLVERVARHYEVPGLVDVRQFLREDLDAVLVATPDRSHLALATTAIRAGKHVLVEKPMADNAAGAEELAELAADSGLKLQVGAMKRHDPGIEYAKQYLPRIGPVITAQAWYRVMAALRPPTEATLFPKTIVDEAVREVEATYKADRERYLLNTHGAHVFDGVRHLIGEVATVRAEVAHVGKDFSWHGTGRLAESGGLASFEISANVHAEWAEGFDIYGESGHLSVRSFFPFFRRASEVALFIEGEATTISPSFGDTDPYERQLEAFARAILDGGPVSPSAEDGVSAVRFIEAVRASAGSGGKEVRL